MVCKQLKIPLTSQCGIQNDQGAHSMPRECTHSMTDRPPAWTMPTWHAGSIVSCGVRHTGASHQHGTVKNVIRQTRSCYATVAVSTRGDWWQMHAELSDDAGLAVAHVWDDGSHTREHACSDGLSSGTRLYYGQC
ncbi:hypothetical protein JTE90_021156 [Oedothorax gibbosus]|uniref:Uncharacterized protein n=1 Tax=Oedothorax gibbosus TaxID=931172 RepID=A0AAV6U1B4_9ARAC|nr:hypothetical protein JTE90_021156 [Oedothorax gibbosus]